MGHDELVRPTSLSSPFLPSVLLFKKKKWVNEGGKRKEGGRGGRGGEKKRGGPWETKHALVAASCACLLLPS